jgi:hypothetical protein
MQLIRDLVAPFGAPRAYYFNSCRFSKAVEAFGVETTGISCLENGRPGFRLELCSGTNEFEVVLDGNWVQLGLIRVNVPRVTLTQGGAASATTWEQFAQTIKRLEDK